MEANADEQQGFEIFEIEWLLEANMLRSETWGGRTVITAYSRMAGARVMLHLASQHGACARVGGH